MSAKPTKRSAPKPAPVAPSPDETAPLVVSEKGWAEFGRILKDVPLPQWHALITAIASAETALGMKPADTTRELRLMLACEITEAVRIAQFLRITNDDMKAAPDRVAFILERLNGKPGGPQE